MRGRRLAFDYGDVRTGVALSDFDAILSSPLCTLKSKGNRFYEEISEIITEHQPICIYVGLPKNMSGTTGESVVKVETFVAALRQLTEIPISMIDERLSTVFAQSKLKDAGVSSRESANLIDAMAAVAILEQGIASEAKS